MRQASVVFPSFRWWRERSIWTQVLLMLFGPVSIMVMGYFAGRAIDCSPGQQDGQCGLATFSALMVSAMVAAALLVTLFVSTVAAQVMAWRERRGGLG